MEHISFQIKNRYRFIEIFTAKKNMKQGTKKSTFANNRQTIVSSNRKILLRAFIIFDCEIMNSVESKEMCLQEIFVWNGSMCNIDEILKMRSLFEMML